MVACLFLGAVMPLVITLVAEFAPEKRKSAIVAITFTGFPLGTVNTGFLALTTIPTLGCQWLLGTGTVLELILLRRAHKNFCLSSSQGANCRLLSRQPALGLVHASARTAQSEIGRRVNLA